MAVQLISTVDGTPRMFDQSEVASAIAGGAWGIAPSQTQTVISPEGMRVAAKGYELADALRAGFRIETDQEIEAQRQADMAKYAQERVEANAKYLEQYQGLQFAPVAQLTSAASALSLGGTDLLAQAVPGATEYIRNVQEAQPVATTVGALGGVAAGVLGAALIPVPGTAEAAATAGISRLASLTPLIAGLRLGETIGVAASKIVPRALRGLTQVGVRGAVQGMVFGAGQDISEQSLGDAAWNGEQLAASAGLGAVFGTATELGFLGAGAAVGKGREWVRRLVAKSGQTVEMVSIPIEQRIVNTASEWLPGKGGVLKDFESREVVAGGEIARKAAAQKIVEPLNKYRMDRNKIEIFHRAPKLKEAKLRPLIRTGNEDEVLDATSIMMDELKTFRMGLEGDFVNPGILRDFDVIYTALEKDLLAVNRFDKDFNLNVFMVKDKAKRRLGTVIEKALGDFSASSDEFGNIAAGTLNYEATVASKKYSTAFMLRDKVYEPLRLSLEDFNLHGLAGQTQKIINAKATVSLGMSGVASELFGKTGKKINFIGTRATNEKLVENFVNKNDQTVFEMLDRKLVADNEYLDTLTTMYDLDKNIYLGIKEDIFKSRKSLQEARDIVKLQESARALFNKDAQSGAGTAMAGIGGSLGWAVGGPLGAAVGAAGATAVASPGATVMRLHSMAKVLGRMRAKTKGLVDTVVQGTDKGRALAVAVATAVVKRAITVEMVRDYKENTRAAIERLGDALSEVHGVAPEHAMSMAASTANVLHHLAQAYPEAPFDSTRINPFRAKGPEGLTREQRRDFDNLARVAVNPDAVLEDVARGTMSVRAARFLKAAYPRYYRDLQCMIVESAVASGAEIGYDRRVMLSLLFEVALDPTMKQDRLAQFQAQYEPTQGESPLEATTPKIRMEGIEGIDASRYATQDSRLSGRRIGT